MLHRAETSMKLMQTRNIADDFHILNGLCRLKHMMRLTTSQFESSYQDSKISEKVQQNDHVC